MSDLRIYVACLASYNAGRLHGAWIDCEGKDGDDIREEVTAMLRASPTQGAEEWAIHDHEGFGRLVDEHTSFDDVATIAEALSGDNVLAFRWLIEDRGMKVDEAAERAEDVTIWESDRGQSDESMLADYAAEFTEETGGLEGCPTHLRNYIDWEAMGRDFRLGGDIDLADISGTRFIVANASEF